MISIDELNALIEDYEDEDDFELTRSGYQGCIGESVALMPGVRGKVVNYDGDDTVIRVKVQKLRHALHVMNQ